MFAKFNESNEHQEKGKICEKTNPRSIAQKVNLLILSANAS